MMVLMLMLMIVLLMLMMVLMLLMLMMVLLMLMLMLMLMLCCVVFVFMVHGKRSSYLHSVFFAVGYQQRYWKQELCVGYRRLECHILPASHFIYAFYM